MAEATLSDIQTRVRNFLADSGKTAWADEQLSEGIRLALGEYNLLAVEPATLKGLDLAEATTLPALHESLLVLGAAGYTVRGGRAGALSTPLPEEYGQDRELSSWADSVLREYQRQLAQASETALLADLRNGSQAWSGWSEPGSIHYGEGWDRR